MNTGIVAARDWVPQQAPDSHTAVTAHTTDDELEAIATRLRANFAEHHDGELTGLEDYLTGRRGELRDAERDKLVRLAADLRPEADALDRLESLLVEHLFALRDRAFWLHEPRNAQIRAMASWSSPRDLGALGDLPATMVRQIIAGDRHHAAELPSADRDRPPADLELHAREHEKETRWLETLLAGIVADIEERKALLLRAARENRAAGLPLPDDAARLLAREEAEAPPDRR